MCGIVGISNQKQDVANLVSIMLSSMATRGPDGVGIASENDTVYLNTINDFKPDSIHGHNVLGHNRLAIVGGSLGSQPFFSCDNKFSLLHNGEIYNYKILRNQLLENHRFVTKTDSEVIIHLFEEEYAKNNGNFLDAIRNTINNLDGIFALAIREESTGKIALIRDRLGVRPLYYIKQDNSFMFASEKKAFWSIGLYDSIKTIAPGYCLIVDDKNHIFYNDLLVTDFSIKTYYELEKKDYIFYNNMHSAVNSYHDALVNSMIKRTQDLKKIGIIFSGGIDSVLIAFLAKKLVPDTICYTCGIKDSNDIKFAQYVSKILNLNLKVQEFTEDDIAELLPKLMYIIEDNNMGQMEVAIPVYGAINLAREDEIRVMFTGQGADELFAGYSWYPKIVQKQGYIKLREHMIEDLQLLYRETLEREDKISMANSIEIREPYLDSQVVDTALHINHRLNIRNHNNIPDPLGKRVHRFLAKKMGIPVEISYRIKEAAQHGSGMHAILNKLARKNGFTENILTKDYLDKLQKRERVGSSQRYGHYFEKEKIWSIDPHIQLYLDEISSNTLPKVKISKKK